MDDESIIDCVRNNPCLYDKNHPDFKDLDKKNDIWKDIATTLTVEEAAVKERWRTLRGHYVTEIRNGRKSSRSGGKHKWPLSENMQFLKDYITPRPMRQKSPVFECNIEVDANGDILNQYLDISSQSAISPKQSASASSTLISKIIKYNKSDDEKLVESVRNWPCLYDKTHRDFKYSGKKRIAWIQIAKDLETEVTLVMKRWENLRTRFAKENRIFRNSSAGSDKKPWPLLENLQFLREHVITRPTTQSPPSMKYNVEVNTDCNILGEFFEISTQDATLPTQPASPLSITGTIKKNKTDDERLIEYVRNRACLYDRNHRDFKYLGKKRLAWIEIAKNLELDEHTVMKRWTNLRERFSKEIRITRKSSEWQWPLLQNMQFLKDHIIARPMRQSSPLFKCNIEVNTNCDILNESGDNSLPSAISPSQSESSISRTIKYNKIDDEKLIECVRDWPCLYDKNHPDYKGIAEKRHAWTEIAKNLEANETVVMKRWGNLRERFSKEIKISRNSSERQWHLFENLKFLKEHIIPRPLRPSLPPVECNMEANESSDNLNISCDFATESASPKFRKKKPISVPLDQLDTNVLQAVKKLLQVCARKTHQEEYSAEIAGFNRMLCSAISNMKKKNQLVVMRRCTEIVKQAQEDELEDKQEENK